MSTIPPVTTTKMRCHICNKVLTYSEIKVDNHHGGWNPCSTCVTASAVNLNELLLDTEPLEAMLSVDYEEEEEM